jgi:hypothetical protein
VPVLAIEQPAQRDRRVHDANQPAVAVARERDDARVQQFPRGLLGQVELVRTDTDRQVHGVVQAVVGRRGLLRHEPAESPVRHRPASFHPHWIMTPS